MPIQVEVAYPFALEPLATGGSEAWGNNEQDLLRCELNPPWQDGSLYVAWEAISSLDNAQEYTCPSNAQLQEVCFPCTLHLDTR